jgi:hypothetical protein
LKAGRAWQKAEAARDARRRWAHHHQKLLLLLLLLLLLVVVVEPLYAKEKMRAGGSRGWWGRKL